MDIESVPEKAYAITLKSIALKRFPSLAETGVALKVESKACETGIVVVFWLESGRSGCADMGKVSSDFCGWLKEAGLSHMYTKRYGDLKRKIGAILPTSRLSGFWEAFGAH